MTLDFLEGQVPLPIIGKGCPVEEREYALHRDRLLRGSQLTPKRWFVGFVSDRTDTVTQGNRDLVLGEIGEQEVEGHATDEVTIQTAENAHRFSREASA